MAKSLEISNTNQNVRTERILWVVVRNYVWCVRSVHGQYARLCAVLRICAQSVRGCAWLYTVVRVLCVAQTCTTTHRTHTTCEGKSYTIYLPGISAQIASGLREVYVRFACGLRAVC